MSDSANISNWSLKSRMVGAFIVPACLVLLAGLSGLYFLRAISDEARSVTDVATPIFQASQKLTDVLYEMGRASFAGLQNDDAGTMEEQSKNLKKLSSDFEAALTSVERLTKDNLLDLGAGSPHISQQTDRSTSGTSSKEGLGLEKAKSTEKDFSRATATAIENRMIYLRKQKDVQQRTNDMTAEFSESEKRLAEVRNSIESVFSSSEERAKTHVQSGAATVDQLNSIIQNFYNSEFPTIEAAYKLQQKLMELRQTVDSFLAANNADKSLEAEKKNEAVFAEINSRLKRTVHRVSSAQVKRDLTRFQENLERLRGIISGEKGLFASHRESLEAQSTAESSEKVMRDSLRNCETTINQFTARVNAINSSLNAAAKAKINETLSQSQTWAIAITVVGFAVSVFLGLILAGNLSRPIRRLAEQAYLVSQGDLRLQLESQHRGDEIGVLSKAFSNMVEGLRTQTRQINQGVEILASSVKEISVTVAQMTESVSRASSAVTETTSTAEELRQAGKLSAEKAKVVAETAQDAVKASMQGTQATKDTITKMSLIREQMTSVVDTVVRLNENTVAIGTIVETVQDLADQSNLLAVNASIEAARAGDHGKGFAVVAQEIKSLSDQSKNATEHIGTILGEITKSVNRVVMAAEQGSKAVQDGVEQSRQSADSIRELEGLVAKSSQAATIIDASTSQQFTGIDQVVSAMASIEDVMHQLVAVSSQLKSGASRLSDLGDGLNALSEKYKS
jgi:methyl-accepting chemotaxis protein